MRWIQKPAETPAAIREYVEAQTPVGHGLDYDTFGSTGAPGGGSRGGQLCGELVAQQHGLCAYTGAGIDERLGEHEAENLAFRAHNEHLKPRSVCKAEMLAAGRVWGEEVGEDMDPRNIVAALLVSGTPGTKVNHRELFGAAKRKNDTVPIWPTHADCETRFLFDENGGVHPRNRGDDAARQTIELLGLDHYSLETWRREAIAGFFDGVAEAELPVLAALLRVPVAGSKLPEYSFAILQILQGKLPPPVV
jgi:hypothetical protein